MKLLRKSKIEKAKIVFIDETLGPNKGQNITAFIEWNNKKNDITIQIKKESGEDINADESGLHLRLLNMFIESLKVKK